MLFQLDAVAHLCTNTQCGKKWIDVLSRCRMWTGASASPESWIRASRYISKCMSIMSELRIVPRAFSAPVRIAWENESDSGGSRLWTDIELGDGVKKTGPLRFTSFTDLANWCASDGGEWCDTSLSAMCAMTRSLPWRPATHVSQCFVHLLCALESG